METTSKSLFNVHPVWAIGVLLILASLLIFQLVF